MIYVIDYEDYDYFKPSKFPKGAGLLNSNPVSDYRSVEINFSVLDAFRMKCVL